MAKSESDFFRLLYNVAGVSFLRLIYRQFWMKKLKSKIGKRHSIILMVNLLIMFHVINKRLG